MMRINAHTAALVSLVLAFSAAPVHAQPAEDSKVASVLKEMAQLQQEIETVKVDVVFKMVMTAQGFKQEQETVYRARFQRPNLFAVEGEGGMFPVTTVSDGEKLYIYYPAMQKYTVENAPETMAGTNAGEAAAMMSMGAAAPFQIFLFPTESFVDTVMEGVREASYLGEDEIDGTSCHHLSFQQEDMDWELWVEKGDQPLARKLTLDMSDQIKSMAAEGAGAGMLKGASMEMVYLFDNWEVDVPLSDDAFQFEPPAEAEKVDSIFGALMDGDEDPHSLVGQKAPDFQLPRLDGEQFQLKQHEDEVIMLDFWATWCPPCVEGLPLVAAVADELEGKGVRFYAVNVGEDEETVREFLSEQELSVPVLLDQDGAVSELYEASAIPQTVLIGKGGRVQVVHVGLGSNIEATLRQQLEALLEGKDLANEQLEKAAEERSNFEEVEPRNLEQVWAAHESVGGVATDDANQTVYAVDTQGRCLNLNREGVLQSAVQLNDRPSVLRTANLIGDDAAELLTFTSWGRAVKAHNAEGDSLWTYALSQGVNDVWPHDLDGDGLAEVIIGYNGSTGLHVLDNRGKLLWKNTGIGNVWHVTAGDVRGSSQPEVVTTSAQGIVHIFSADGEKIADVSTSCYADTVRIASGNPLAEPQIIVGGSDSAGEVLLGMSPEGHEHWKVTLSGEDGVIESAQPASGTPWVAVGMRGGAIHVVDVQKGDIIASHAARGNAAQTAWLRTDSEPSPLLLVATGRLLTALRVLEKAPQGAPSGDASD